MGESWEGSVGGKLPLVTSKKLGEIVADKV